MDSVPQLNITENSGSAAAVSCVEISADGCSYKLVLPNKDTDIIQNILAAGSAPHDHDMLRSMGRRLVKNDFVIDIGAKIGNHTLYLTGVKECNVAAFEPDTVLSDALMSSVKINGFDDKVGIYTVALGMEKGKGHFERVIPENFGAQRIETGSGEIRIEPLDKFDFPQKVKAIRIDVKGMELDVLKGGQAIILKDRPDIYIECQTQSCFMAVNSWLTENNYVYWDTFITTPTHLFIPDEHISMDERLERLPEKIGQILYGAAEHDEMIISLKHELQKTKKALTDANYRLMRARHRISEAELQAAKARNTLSYQLGYLLIQGFKSFRGFLGLPSAYLAWRREAARRKSEKHELRELAASAGAALNIISSLDSSVGVGSQKKMVSVSEGPGGGADFCVGDYLPPELAQKKLRQLRMACVMDEFSYESFRYECETLQLTPDGWLEEIEAFKPDLLFIESAWRGKDELWHNKIANSIQELQDILAWCSDMKVPTVFWNKEDPVHYGTFLNTARLFDYVFTTDIDCIHRYKAELQHERVYLLPFGCQPRLANPVEICERKDAFCFAGSYYDRYPERTRDLEDFVENLPSFRPVEIYDRNYGLNNLNYQFPPEYRPYIVGGLPFERIDKAYKGYRYAINLNSIKHSQSMFARRVFELLASNTITVSNFSRGVRLLFGDLVICTDSGKEALRRLKPLVSSSRDMRKFRLAGLRKVMQEHTYGQRLAYVAAKLSGFRQEDLMPEIAVLASATTQRDLEMELEFCGSQNYAKGRFYIMVGEGVTVEGKDIDSRIRVIPDTEVAKLKLRDLVKDADMVAGISGRDYYGPNYLLDIALAARYSGAEVIGKGAYYAMVDGAIRLENGNNVYRPSDRLAARSSAVRVESVSWISVGEWLGSLDTKQFTSENMLAIDEFNYCRDGWDKSRLGLISESVDDLQGIDTGMSVGELQARAEKIAPEVVSNDGQPVITGRELASIFASRPSSAIKLFLDNDSWHVISRLPNGKHEYLYSSKCFSREELGAADVFRFYLDVTAGLNIQLVIFFLDERGEKIGHVIKYSNRNEEVAIPEAASKIRLALRFYAGGSSEILGLVLGHLNIQTSDVIGRSDCMLLTNYYPSYTDLYRHGFVHTRVRAYRERGVKCDIFLLQRQDNKFSFSEFEEVDVISGSPDVLDKMLAGGRYRHVLIHFLDHYMWDIMRKYADRMKVTVWVHGAEIHPWYRRDFNYLTEEELSVAKSKSGERMEFWRGLLQSVPANLKLVFVSHNFAEEVMEDLGFRIPEDKYTVIHNPVNTEQFSYREKDPEQRKRVLSIRPYVSRQYANDLSVKVIQLLSSEPWFKEMEFRLIGDGPLFEETLEPLRKFANVCIEKRFLRQDEIAKLHKEYGIFLCPTRWDSQGVSRDEAMSSGLVPVTNAVAAVPEFVDSSCGILAPGEDAGTMAEGIAKLYNDPSLFARMSALAAERVRLQRGRQQIITSELELFTD
jgi:FkbM family methyltransferase